MQKKHIPLIILGFAFIVLIFLWSSITGTIDTAQRGILFRTFSGGIDTVNVYGEGFYFKSPWDKMEVVDVSDTKKDENMQVLSSNALPFDVDITIRFRPMYVKVASLYKKFRQGYIENLVVPEMRSVVREVIGSYTVEELSKTKRNEIENKIQDKTRQILSRNGVQLLAIKIRGINLPEKIKDAIKEKETQKQVAEAYMYKLDKEKSEAERLRIEAEGKAAANRILDASLTDKILREKGIQATIELSSSPNSKTVIIGSGKDGLPLILGDK